MCFASDPGRDERQMMDGGRDKVRGGREADVEEKKKQNGAMRVMIHRAGHKVGCGREPTRESQGEITNREREIRTEVTNRM